MPTFEIDLLNKMLGQRTAAASRRAKKTLPYSPIRADTTRVEKVLSAKRPSSAFRATPKVPAALK